MAGEDEMWSKSPHRHHVKYILRQTVQHIQKIPPRYDENAQYVYTTDFNSLGCCSKHSSHAETRIMRIISEIYQMPYGIGDTQTNNIRNVIKSNMTKLYEMKRIYYEI